MKSRIKSILPTITCIFFLILNGLAQPMREGIVATSPGGSLDPTFQPGIGTNDAINAVVLQSDGKILLGGSFTSFNGTPRNYLARLNPDGSLDPTFDPAAGANDTVTAIAVQSDGKILLAGNFTSVNGTPANHIARLLPAPGAISFSSSQYSINENGGTAQLTLSRMGGTDNPVVAKVTVTGGTASTADYQMNPDALADSDNPDAEPQVEAQAENEFLVTWAAGDSTNKTISISSVEDGLVEGDEDITFSLSLVSGGATFGADATAKVTIVDNDVAAGIEDGSFELPVTAPGPPTYYLNRITPTSYPATLSGVSVWFSNQSQNKVGDAIQVVVGTDSSNGQRLNGTQFQRTNATVQALERFDGFTVPKLTITSGDFLVGIVTTGTLMTDFTTAYKQRSYYSQDNGATFATTPFLGNLPIRAAFTQIGSVTSVSAASYNGDILAPEEIISAFGENLGTATAVATTFPLPTALAGTTVKIKDAQGTERLALLTYVSTGQVNYLMPAGTANGVATITITNGTGFISKTYALIGAVAPGIFTANQNGQGVVSASVKYVSGQTVRSEPTVTCDAKGQNCTARPIDLNSAEQVFLELYGTGIRHHSGLVNVMVTIGGEAVPVLYADKQPDFMGLDQLNVQLPRSLSKRGEIEILVTVDGRTANPARINFK